MVVIALIALVQLAVLVMILAVVTSPSSSSGTADPVDTSQRKIGQLEHLTIEGMMAEAERSRYQTDEDWNQ